MRVECEEAFVLHSRPYRETSRLVDIFTRHYGRFRVVARGSRGGSARKRSLNLMPFTLLQLSWSGQSELKNLMAAESVAATPFFRGKTLYSGFYLNELMIRLLAEHDPHEGLFDHYRESIQQLASEENLEILLRQFEMRLLNEIGYELVVDVDVVSGEPVHANASYRYDAILGGVEQVFSAVQPGSLQRQMELFSGRSLLSIAGNELMEPEVLSDAKRLLRLALKPHLGDRPLQSRKLFQALGGKQ
ncbi:MAG: DNA repair protein RecO [Porticoccaceae bacterium]|nr:DNA repair protein RecO [Pseudomonadales bacterium]MCP5171806.1 DNA repair protein RecO [Pseudomonadales bacterium]